MRSIHTIEIAEDLLQQFLHLGYYEQAYKFMDTLVARMYPADLSGSQPA